MLVRYQRCTRSLSRRFVVQHVLYLTLELFERGEEVALEEGAWASALHAHPGPTYCGSDSLLLCCLCTLAWQGTTRHSTARHGTARRPILAHAGRLRVKKQNKTGEVDEFSFGDLVTIFELNQQLTKCFK